MNAPKNNRGKIGAKRGEGSGPVLDGHETKDQGDNLPDISGLSREDIVLLQEQLDARLMELDEQEDPENQELSDDTEEV